MNIIRTLIARCATLVVALAVSAAAFAPHPHALVPADKIKWGPGPAALPPGAQISVLEGDPGQKGDVTLRLQFPANYTIPPHWHNMTERLSVRSSGCRDHSTFSACMPRTGPIRKKRGH